MSGGKESPRQKMVGMMYLVLTALLALNISKDVLDAFIVVNNGLEKTNLNFSNRNEELYAEFNLAKSVNPVRVTPNWEKAQIVKAQSDSLISFIDELKTRLISETDGIPLEIADTIQMQHVKSKDNHDVITNLMIGDSEDGSDGISLTLKTMLMDYRSQLNNYILPEDLEKVEIDINTDDPVDSENNENWEMYNFYHRPLVAGVTILSKIENDIKNAESTVVDYLLRQADVGNLKFDTVAAKVIPMSNYVLLGEEYKADVFLAAFNKTRNPEINVGSNELSVNKGVGDYHVKTNREGLFEYSGDIKVVAPSGKEIVFPFKSEYIVAKPALTVSADKMNVLYYGLKNPISVSVPGIPNERLTVTINNGSMTPLGNGKYMVKPGRGYEANVSVVATMENGEKKSMGKSTFRVMQIPDPSARYALKTEDGILKRGELRINDYLFAYYDNFVFKAKPEVKSFTIEYKTKGSYVEEDIPGNKIPKKIKDDLLSLKKGSTISFTNIKAVGPDGRKRPLSRLTFKLQ